MCDLFVLPLNRSPTLIKSLPGSEGLQLVVGKVKHPEVFVSSQQRHTLVCQVVIGHIKLLQAAEAVL